MKLGTSKYSLISDSFVHKVTHGPIILWEPINRSYTITVKPTNTCLANPIKINNGSPISILKDFHHIETSSNGYTAFNSSIPNTKTWLFSKEMSDDRKSNYLPFFGKLTWHPILDLFNFDFSYHIDFVPGYDNRNIL